MGNGVKQATKALPQFSAGSAITLGLTASSVSFLGADGLTHPLQIPVVAGPQGPIGATGAQGLPGVNGTNGTQGIQGIPGATGPAGPINDFWRSGAGATTQPDGVADLTENIRRNGLVGVGVDPLSNIDNVGSFGSATRTTVAVATLITATDHTVRLTAAALQTVTLPTAASANRRIYYIVNPTSFVKAFAASVTGTNDLATTVIPALSSITLQSNGVSWEIIDSSASLISAPVGGQVAAFVALNTPVSIDNIRLEARLLGGQGFRISTVAGTSTVNISAVTSFATDSVFGSNRATVALTTTMVHPFAWAGQSDADAMTGHIYDRSNNRFYEFSIMTNVAPVLSYIRITRVI